MDTLRTLFPLLIPLVAIVMGIGIGMLSLFLDYRKKREMYALHHKERLAAIEKGVDLPPLPPEFFEGGRGRGWRRNDPHTGLRKGLFWLFVGIAITVALYTTHSSDVEWTWGLVPIAIGLARLVYYKLAEPVVDPAKPADEQGPRPGA